MGQGGLYILVLLGLLVAASERNKDYVTQCWTKGREVILQPHQCPAEFDGADAKFCCRLCYGANCCQPRRPRVNQDRCPPAARLLGTSRDRRAVPDAKTAVKLENQVHWYHIAIFGLLLIMAILFLVFYCSSDHCRRCWDSCNPPRSLLRSNVYRDHPCMSPALRLGAPPVYSLVDPHRTHDLPPPYPGKPEADPQGVGDLPPAYPGPPVVAFHRASSQAQEDSAVILSLQVTPSEAAASGGARGAAVTGRAPEKVGPLVAAASGGALRVVVLQEKAASRGASGAAVTGRAPKKVGPLEAAASGVR